MARTCASAPSEAQQASARIGAGCALGLSPGVPQRYRHSNMPDCPGPDGEVMTDRLALILALAIVGAVGLDLWQGWGGTIFLARKFLLLVDWVAFWR